MEKIGDWQSRKKNNADPLSHPVWFFKGKNRTPGDEKKLTLQNYEKKVKDKLKQDQAEYQNIGYVVTGLQRMPAATRKIMEPRRAPLYPGASGADEIHLKKKDPLMDDEISKRLAEAGGFKTMAPQKSFKRVSYENNWKT